jgi:PAS domain S-box-containing protein
MSTTLTFAGPFDLALSLKAAASFLPAQGPLPTTLRAGVHLDDRPGLVAVRQSGLRLEAIGPTHLTAAKLHEIAAWLVSADLDLRLFYGHSRSHPVMDPVVDSLFGLKPLRPALLFEMLVIAITEQQLSLAAAFHIGHRLVERFGTRIDGIWVFPTATALAAVPPAALKACGLSARKAEYVTALAGEIAAEASRSRSAKNDERRRGPRGPGTPAWARRLVHRLHPGARSRTPRLPARVRCRAAARRWPISFGRRTAVTGRIGTRAVRVRALPQLGSPLSRGPRASVSGRPSREAHRARRGGHIMSSDFNIDRFCRILAHQAPDAVIYADSRGVIRFWNAGAERIFEFSAAEATGKSLDIIIPENLRARHWAGFDQTMRTGKTRYGAGDILAVPALRKDRMRISIEFTVLPFHDETDHMLGIAAILRDVTKRFEEMKELRRQLAKSSRLAATSVIGAIGVSGGSASQDQAVATAGLAPGGKPSAARPRFGLPTAPVVGEACCHGTPQKR